MSKCPSCYGELDTAMNCYNKHCATSVNYEQPAQVDLIEVVRQISRIACAMSPSIDFVEEAGGLEADDKMWRIHYLMYYNEEAIIAALQPEPDSDLAIPAELTYLEHKIERLQQENEKATALIMEIERIAKRPPTDDLILRKINEWLIPAQQESESLQPQPRNVAQY